MMGSNGSSSWSDSDESSLSTSELLEENEQNQAVASGSTAPALESNPKDFTLGMLFNHSRLREAASKIRDDVPETVVQQHHGNLVRFLNDRIHCGESHVTLSQFCDFLNQRGVSREECVQAFDQFDADDEGQAELKTVLDALRTSNSACLQGDLNYSIRALQACTLIPNLIDIYSRGSKNSQQHGKRLLKYVLKNRAISTNFPFPLLEGFNNTCSMRLSVLKAHFDRQENNVVKELTDATGKEVRQITRCFKTVHVSTNNRDVGRLTDNNGSTYWQSDGATGSHWIRLRLKNDVILQYLSITVNRADQSYKPHHVSVLTGRTPTTLQEVKDLRIQGNATGEVILIQNARITAPYVQINILRCNSDGCDTRIHGLKALGFRVVQTPKISVKDASAVWYFSVLASTATATMPIAPHLRNSIIQHTRTALNFMQPLSLSAASTERPSYLSAPVLDQLETFIDTVSRDIQTGKIDDDGVVIALELALARGSVARVLRALEYALDNNKVEFPVGRMMKSLTTVRETLLKKNSSAIQLSLLGCDGGQKDETSAPANVLTDNWSTETYISEKTQVNMFFGKGKPVQITKVRIKASKGDIAPRAGLVFVYNDSEGFDQQRHVDRFSVYNKFTDTDYKILNGIRSASIGGLPDNPVAYFSFDDDWNEIEVPMDVCHTGRFVLIKFLGPRAENAEKLGIIGIKFNGYSRKDSKLTVLNLSEIAQLNPNSDAPVKTETIFVRILHFLSSLGQDLEIIRRKEVGSSGSLLELEGITTEMIFKHYQKLMREENWIYSQILIIRMLHAFIPHLTKEIMKDDTKDKDKQMSLEKASGTKDVPTSAVADVDNESVQLFFNMLCDIINKTPENAPGADGLLREVIVEAVIDGAAVFFPNKDTRKKKLFAMMNSECIDDKPATSFVFQSLCNYFSSVDPTGLLDLPSDPPKDFDFTTTLNVMETLLKVSLKEFVRMTEEHSGTSSAKESYVSGLLNALQGSLVLWCRNRQTGECNQEAAKSVLCNYVHKHCKYIQEALEVIAKANDPDIFKKVEASFLATTFRQLILCLKLVAKDITDLRISHDLLDISSKIKDLEINSRNIEVASACNKSNTPVTLRVWNVESSHNYENNQHTTQVFFCPGADVFEVTFDPRCETERRYDFLEFTDFRGVVTRYDQKVNSEKWPLKVSFKGGPRLQYVFHSDSSQNEWGYKFTVVAKGSPDLTLSWIVDLQLAICKLLGMLCATSLRSKDDLLKSTPKMDDSANQPTSDDSTEALLKGDLWSSLFRAGHNVNKFSRSLSGGLVSEPRGSTVNTFLMELITGEETSMKIYKKFSEKNQMQSIGGPVIGGTVRAVFAALIWHSQELREDFDKYLEKSESSEATLPEGVHEAFITAETIRPVLVDLRQKHIVATENTITPDQSHDEPVLAWKEKAEFLLEFGGLSKIEPKAQVKTLLRSLSSVNSKENRTKVAHPGTFDSEATFEKHPSFKLVLDFLKDPRFSRRKVEDLLEQRVQRAERIAYGYNFALTFLRFHGTPHIFNVSCVQFLQEMLIAQDKDLVHYAVFIDGCGLDLETKVRKAYYALVQLLTNAIQDNWASPNDRLDQLAVDCVQACLLHLLDVDWQSYDFAFLAENNVPKLLLTIVKRAVSLYSHQTKEPDDVKELGDYYKHKGWFEECQGDNFGTWFKQISTKEYLDTRRCMHMFVAQFCQLLVVKITCDGCGTLLPGSRYHCLDCEDMDLCNTCYLGGAKPSKHKDGHKLVNMMFKCNNCGSFIVGTRVHCNDCEDFDLCYGCHLSSNLPSSHKASHDVDIIPLEIILTGSEDSSQLNTYSHHHAWIQFSALSLSVANTENENRKKGIQNCYSKQIYKQCVDLVVESLEFMTQHKTNIASLADKRKRKLKEAKIKNQKEEEKSSEDEKKTQSVDDGKDDVMASTKDEAIEKKSSEEDQKNVKNEEKEKREEDILKLNKDEEDSAKLETVNETSKSDEKEQVETSKTTPEVKINVNEKKVDVKEELEKEEGKTKDSQDAKKTDGKKAQPVSSVISPDHAFAECSQEKILGLLGAMLKLVNQDSDVTTRRVQFQLERALPILFKWVKDSFGNDTTDQHMAVGLLGQLLAKTSPEIADSALAQSLSDHMTTFDTESTQADAASKPGIVVSQSEILSNICCPGKQTIHFLFSYGARCLEKSGLEWASLVAGILRQLSDCLQWSQVLASHITDCIQELPGNTALAAIFSMFIVAGFPQVPCHGSCAILQETSGDRTDVIIIKHYAIKQRALVVNVDSRKKKEIKEYMLELQITPGTSETTHFATFIGVTKRLINQMKQGNALTVEEVWVLCLSLKSVLATLRKCNDANTKMILNEDLMPLLVFLASKPTRFNRQWLLSDLEIFSIKLYTAEKKSGDVDSTKEDEETEDVEEDTEASSATSPLDSVGMDPLGGLDDYKRTCIQAAHDALEAPLPNLRALFETCGQSITDFLIAIEKSFKHDGFLVSDEVLELSKNWQRKGKGKEEDMSEAKAVDAGAVCYVPSKLKTKKKTNTAIPEPNEVENVLISVNENHLQQSLKKQRRTKSAELLKKELEKHSKVGSREFVHKVNQAVAILYARHVLAVMLADWPDGHPISLKLFGCTDHAHFVGVLDLLQRAEEKEMFAKSIRNIVEHCENELLWSLATAACTFMEENKMSSVTKESAHNYKNDSSEKGSVHIPGAMYLSVKFDEQCATEEGCDFLTMASDVKMKNDIRTFSGGSSNFVNFEMPGDTLHYSFTSDCSNNDWGYKFTVTGGQLGRFITGHILLNEILSNSSKASHIPVNEVWSWLVHVASCQTGQQRLKAIQLMLRLLQAATSSCEDGASQKVMELPDLTLLKPLWVLLNAMDSKQSDTLKCLPPAHCALTELFLVVEDLAKESSEEDYVLAMIPTEDLRKSALQGVCNVASLGLALGIPNKASEAFRQMGLVVGQPPLFQTPLMPFPVNNFINKP
ncbi:zinc finger ZZ-type and EF-hand domain-containing protein 1-like isoform X2 [Antedon mediterranea]|uniref:zinc finger ZZ-type and EF-hand domain-containing protein 1-like isoform X2 n=1 Tax=Antedon mediterranea TaxID=105859 RepID=UPI003AF8E4FA